MSALPENEIVREARRVLRKLADAKARLVRSHDGRWAVVQRGEARSGRVKTTAGMVACFRDRGWLEPGADDALLLLSAVGRAWLTGEWIGTDPYSAQHQLLRLRPMRDDSGEEISVVVNDGESPLGWLHARGTIDDIQLQAGERLRRDYTLAQLEPHVCIDLSAPVVLGSGSANAGFISDTALAAKQRFRKAMSAVGPGLSDLLFDVCCALKGLEAAEKAKGWPRRSGKVVLALALDRLAGHYGIRPAPRHVRMRGWAVEAGAAAG
jgi:hypothetical protein